LPNSSGVFVRTLRLIEEGRAHMWPPTHHTYAGIALHSCSRLIRSKIWRSGLWGLIVISTIVLASGCSKEEALAQAAEKPNILFVLTDDQPQDTMLAMPQVLSRVRDMGMELTNAYVSQSLCCPSRASILRGQYPHNTGVMRNGPPNGGVQTFRESGAEADDLPVWLSQQDYVTALVGKYMNGYDASYKPPGWHFWYAKADANTPGEKVNDNGRVMDFAGEPGNWGDRYSEQLLAFLQQRTNQDSDEPFAMFFWTTQPHLEAKGYADRYANLYSDANLNNPQPSFDEQDVQDKLQWVQNLDRIDTQEQAQLRQWRVNQLRSVRQVDDTVGAMLDLLENRGELENTYVVFTTDNGTHMGEHRWFYRLGAKSTAYEEAANVLMYVRGPGIPAGSTSDELVLNNDLAPTFVDIAGGTPPAFVDGRTLLPVWTNTASDWRTAIMNEQPLGGASPAPPYHALMTRRYTYVEYATTGEKELYDRALDPYELESKHEDAGYADTLAALSLRLHTLEGCKTDACRTAENGP
jgi:N-acetylglucosamine-6-sulfatase